MSLEQYFASRNSRMKASEIRELLKLLTQPDIISFAGGIPDPDLFPAQAFQQAMTEALSDGQHAVSLQYSTSEGYLPLRRWIRFQMQKLGITCGDDNILITSGSQQALDYLGKLFLSPRDTALVGWPTYLGALGAFNAYEPEFDRLDPNCNRPSEDIRATAQAGGGQVKFAYMSPDFANPTGITMSETERQSVLRLAEDLDCAVIEDAAYQGLRYDGNPLPPILAMEMAQKGDINACRTIYCGSFSKTLSPGLRVGWVCGAQKVIDQLVLLKQAGDLHSPTLNQIAIHKVASEGFESHIAKLQDHYRGRRDVMLAALERDMPPGVSWTHPEGGMFIWLTLPKGLDGALLLETALQTEKVAFVPGAAFHPDGTGTNTLRLNFSSPNAAQIEAGIARLGRVLKNVLN